MEAFIAISGMILMPIYAFAFILCFAGMLYNLKKDEQISGYAVLAGIFFALMMWTISGSILLAGG
ncbi:hypothetical protein RB620_04860 [Paenibacillus sp. LHD-117]|uniref:hypothetical protein n=1 Tax=Paenibacillus sp. LHD-117 TaxID=3071412 RepID=UPI0027E07797|nr:hypothetical protein [Paenibacillus sp. LHD-117]MDQ6418765.1 hypothetical protein [Paenibacillus sp. LHD-117]